MTDLNECLENPSICGENVCVNSYGTYTCLEPSSTSTTSTTTPETPTTISTTEESIKHNKIIENENENEEKTNKVDDVNEKIERRDEILVESDSEDNENYRQKAIEDRRKTTSSESDADDENEDDNENDDEEESVKIKSESGENVDTEINKIPEAPSRLEKEEDEEEENEIESDKVRQHGEDLYEENTTETREIIDNEIPEAVHIHHSTPEPVESITTPDSSLHIQPTTITHHYAVSETENESVENSTNDNDEDDVDREEEYTRMHHQSSTVKLDLRNECDDELRLDDTGNCIGMYLY